MLINQIRRRSVNTTGFGHTLRTLHATRLPLNVELDSGGTSAVNSSLSSRAKKTRLRVLFLLAACLGIMASGAAPAAVASPKTFQYFSAAQTDSIYSLYHPRLLFDTGEIPALYNKVRDGGHDDLAYSFIRVMIDYIWPGQSELQMLDDDFGLSTLPMLGMATFLESPEDETARTMGRDLTLYVANNYGVDFDDFSSSLRLRALALGYDLFFKNASEPERVLVRDEIVSYITFILNHLAYQVFNFRPYLSNRSAMMGAAVGLGALCLADEADSSIVADALDFSERIIGEWLAFQVDDDGAYNEGVLYAAWSLRNLVYYFTARKRYDGFSFAADKVRGLESWFVYELLPEGNGRANNLNDSGYTDNPLPQHHSYFDWAQAEWGSNLSAYLYEHVAGTYGWDMGAKADKTATVLWNQNLTPQQPDSILPPSRVWMDRGLYYFRTGWPSGDNSEDVVFSFYSGKFQGGHAQEDQNQFTLCAYGAKFAIDHGPGYPGKESQSHNMVMIDGKGQHNAGASIGTDGDISQYLITNFVDFLQGDATAAYTTYSPLNRRGNPFPTTDWSWGYDGGNPVNFARRNVFVLHDVDTIPPYFFVFDDIEKDGFFHSYEWRMHTANGNTVDTTGVATRITAPTARMNLHMVNPPRSSVSISLSSYNNLSVEPDSKLLSYTTTAVNPRFAFLLVPNDGSMPDPLVDRADYPWGVTASVDWGFKTDMFVLNFSGGSIGLDVAGLTPPVHARSRVSGQATPATTVATDATSLLLRFDGTGLKRFLATEVTDLTIDGIPVVSVADGPLSVCFSSNTISIDRYDADFVFYAPGLAEIRYRDQQVHFVDNGGYLTPDPVVGIDAPRAGGSILRASAFPNPFNPSTTITFDLASKSRVTAVVYDPLGRRIKLLAASEYGPGHHTLTWEGVNENGRKVASGVYFLKLSARGEARVVKLTLIK